MDILKTSFSPPFEDWELLLFNINPRIFIGPGQYELKDGSARGGLMTTREQRFKSSRNENPGPGSYEVCVWFWRMDLEIKKKNYYNNSDNDKTNAFESLKIRAPSKVKPNKRTFWFILTLLCFAFTNLVSISLLFKGNFLILQNNSKYRNIIFSINIA